MDEFLIDAPKSRARAAIVLAHGAGAPMDTPFMTAMTAAIVARGVGVIRFEFAFMAARRKGSRKPPARTPVLMDEYRAVVAAAGRTVSQRFSGANLYIGGKSMGGRIASMIADEASQSGSIRGCVCLGYPFHPAGRPDQWRTAHLIEMQCPTLIIQGERDPLGNRDEVSALQLSPAVEIAWITDGDHDLKPRVKSGSTHADAIAAAATLLAEFIAKQEPSRRR